MKTRRRQEITNEDRRKVKWVYDHFFKDSGGWKAMDICAGASEEGHGKFFESIVNKRTKKKLMSAESFDRLDEYMAQFERFWR